ncbi:hypothetical protein ACOMHN_000564 [Nucella lapillus]
MSLAEAPRRMSDSAISRDSTVDSAERASLLEVGLMNVSRFRPDIQFPMDLNFNSSVVAKNVERVLSPPSTPQPTTFPRSSIPRQRVLHKFLLPKGARKLSPPAQAKAEEFYVKMTLAVNTLAFFMLFIPVSLIILFENVKIINFPSVLHTCVLMVIYLHSSCHPFVYAFTNSALRRRFKQLLTCRPEERRQSFLTKIVRLRSGSDSFDGTVI